jgi:hypothetical protein
VFGINARGIAAQMASLKSIIDGTLQLTFKRQPISWDLLSFNEQEISVPDW